MKGNMLIKNAKLVLPEGTKKVDLFESKMASSLTLI